METHLFNIDELQLPQDFSKNLDVRKLTPGIPIRKPNRQEFIRTHSGEGMSINTLILKVEEDNEIYLVNPSLWEELHGELKPVFLYVAINRQEVLTVWPVKMTGNDGRPNRWNQSAFEAAEAAKSKWIRVVSNKSLGAYEIYAAPANIPEPKWPELTLQQILDIAFKDNYITNLDHPAIRRLRGEI